MKRIALLLILLCAFGAAQAQKKAYMWLDCEANFQRLSTPDSVQYYAQRLKDAGITDLVVDAKSIMGEVVYKSQIAPYMGEWNGHSRSADYDLLREVTNAGHRIGLRVHASLNIFAGGHNFKKRGIIYNEHPEWQSQVYWHNKIMPISEMHWNYNGMLNPANPTVQQYELDILEEFARRYTNIDGIVFDRMRYDDITSDFSDLSRKQFETYIGKPVRNFPNDILYWAKGRGENKGKEVWKQGPLFKQWIEWRASVIKQFAVKAFDLIRKINPKIEVSDYTGGWYPTYYQVGANWASEKYNPAKEFRWATSNYYKTGYADLLDTYMTGLYYTQVTKAEVDNSNAAVGIRTEAGMSSENSYWYCIEGGAEHVKRLTAGVVPIIGSIYVEQYKGDPVRFEKAIKQASQSCDGGVMVFDLVHIIQHNWWGELKRSLANLNDSSITEPHPGIAASSSSIRYVGRTHTSDNGSVSFDWVGTHLSFRFTGDYCAVHASDSGKSYYNLTIDNEESKVITISGRDTLIVLAQGLTQGEHLLRLQKRTEGEQGCTTLHYVVLSTAGELLPPKIIPNRHIEFIGNSLTCGYGTEALSGTEPFRAETENCDKSYACITARYFGADYTLIAHSGRGAVRNYGDKQRVSTEGTMRDRFSNTFDMGAPVEWTASKDTYKPDLVVIHLGTNDFSTKPYPTEKEFATAYLDILAKIRTMHGVIPILCIAPSVSGPAFEAVQASVAQSNDPNVYFAAIFPNYCNRTSDLGASEHPNYVGQQKMAMLIIPYISTITGWAIRGE